MAPTVDPDTRSKWIIIGISGVTCGGKTTLATRLLSTLYPVHVFNQDKYFYPDDSPRHVRCRDLDHNNYDVLSSLDMEAFHSDVVDTLRGGSGAHSSCTDPTCPPGPGAPGAPGRREGVEGKQFLIIEGFTVLNYAPLNDLCDLRYYVVLEYAECLSRRVLRLYDPPDVAGYFEQCVWPEHISYRAQIEKDKRVRLLDGSAPDMFDTVMSEIRALGTTSNIRP